MAKEIFSLAKPRFRYPVGGNIRGIKGSYRDNGKEDGSYYLGNRV